MQEDKHAGNNEIDLGRTRVMGITRGFGKSTSNIKIHAVRKSSNLTTSVIYNLQKWQVPQAPWILLQY